MALTSEQFRKTVAQLREESFFAAPVLFLDAGAQRVFDEDVVPMVDVTPDAATLDAAYTRALAAVADAEVDAADKLTRRARLKAALDAGTLDAAALADIVRELLG